MGRSGLSASRPKAEKCLILLLAKPFRGPDDLYLIDLPQSRCGTLRYGLTHPFAPLTGHTDQVYAVAFSFSPTMVMSPTYDRGSD
jgi:hypothetical protein